MVFANAKLIAGAVLAALVILCLGYVIFVVKQNEQMKATIAGFQVALESKDLVIHDLRESVARKEGAMLAYQNVANQVQKVADNAIDKIRKYKGNGTDSDKCLDLIPPRMYDTDSGETK